jgi:hypothetical protein
MFFRLLFIRKYIFALTSKYPKVLSGGSLKFGELVFGHILFRKVLDFAIKKGYLLVKTLV